MKLEFDKVYDRDTPQTDFGSPKSIETWNAMAKLCVADALAYFVNASGVRVEEPVCDEAGRILWHIIRHSREERPLPHERTLGDVMALDPDDAFDAAMASLPVYASLLEKARAALRANIDGPTIQARLRCSGSLVSRARRELREELREEDWPLSLSNSKAHSRRVNAARPNMTREAGGNPLQLRAKNLGISEAEARQIATAKTNERKFLERPEDVARQNDNRDAARREVRACPEGDNRDAARKRREGE